MTAQTAAQTKQQTENQDTKLASKSGQVGYQFNPTILREYDIRGIVGETLGQEDAYALGCLLGHRVCQNKGQKAVVGYDGRESSPVLSKALMQGFLDMGLQVDCIGLSHSPKLYFAAITGGYDAAVMVTGSHNPGEYNGFKMMLGKESLHGATIASLQDEAAGFAFPEAAAATASQIDVDAAYMARVQEGIELAPLKPLNIVWDCGNGSAGPMVQALTAQLPGTHTLMYEDVDGTFPNHHPDPTVEENLRDIAAKVRETGAAAGIAFDGDGDRIGVVDENGDVVWADQLMALFAEQVLAENQGAPIIADVKSSTLLFKHIAACGGRPVMSKTGHSLIKAKMKEENAPLAGEMSGHIFFADKYYGYDDAVYAALRFLSILSVSKASFSQMIQPLRSMVSTPEIRLECDESRKFTIIEEVAQSLSKAAPESDITVLTVDGVRVETPDGWWLLRASNTQNAVTIRMEAKDKAALKKVAEQCGAYLGESGIALPV